MALRFTLFAVAKLRQINSFHKEKGWKPFFQPFHVDIQSLVVKITTHFPSFWGGKYALNARLLPQFSRQSMQEGYAKGNLIRIILLSPKAGITQTSFRFHALLSKMFKQVGHFTHSISIFFPP
ncbi:MAG: hypothetical protein IJK45_00615 [Bacteroidaceae bacterium]|nr:hypothetical protein [Bacteroidaceae bacterium]